MYEIVLYHVIFFYACALILSCKVRDRRGQGFNFKLHTMVMVVIGEEKGGMSSSSSESDDDLPAISLGRGE